MCSGVGEAGECLESCKTTMREGKPPHPKRKGRQPSHSLCLPCKVLGSGPVASKHVLIAKDTGTLSPHVGTMFQWTNTDQSRSASRNMDRKPRTLTYCRKINNVKENHQTQQAGKRTSHETVSPSKKKKKKFKEVFSETYIPLETIGLSKKEVLASKSLSFQGVLWNRPSTWRQGERKPEAGHSKGAGDKFNKQGNSPPSLVLGARPPKSWKFVQRSYLGLVMASVQMSSTSRLLSQGCVLKTSTSCRSIRWNMCSKDRGGWGASDCPGPPCRATSGHVLSMTSSNKKQQRTWKF